MDCQEARPALGRRFDGEETGADAAALDAHVASCADCARALAAMEATRGFFEAIPAGGAPEKLAARVRDRLRSPEGRLLSIRPLLRTVAAAAAVLLLVSGAALVLEAPPRASVSAATLTEDAALARLLSRVAEDHAPPVAGEEPR